MLKGIIMAICFAVPVMAAEPGAEPGSEYEETVEFAEPGFTETEFAETAEFAETEYIESAELADTEEKSEAVPVDTSALRFLGEVQTDKISASEMTAQVGDVIYGTLQEAVDAADGGTVTLLKDTEVSLPVVVEGSVTIDLGGYTLTNSTDIWDPDYNQWSIISVRGGDLVIGNGTVKAKKNDCYAIDIMDGTCTITDGTYIGNITSIYVYSGELIIKDGYFTVQQEWKSDDKYGLVINCNDTYYESGEAKATAYGGTFEGFNSEITLPEGYEEINGTVYQLTITDETADTESDTAETNTESDTTESDTAKTDTESDTTESDTAKTDTESDTAETNTEADTESESTVTGSGDIDVNEEWSDGVIKLSSSTSANSTSANSTAENTDTIVSSTSKKTADKNVTALFIGALSAAAVIIAAGKERICLLQNQKK